jgi:hypothetical protein
MAEARLIYKKILTSADFVRLSEFEQLIFIAMIITADDWGRLPGDIKVLRGILMPCSDRPTTDLIGAIQKLASVGLIRFEEGYALEILNFGKYQKAYHRRRSTNYYFSNEGNQKPSERSDKGLLEFPTEKSESTPKGIAKVDKSQANSDLEIKIKEKKLKETRSGEYKLKSDPLAKVIYGFKLAMGIDIQDRNWDKTEWGRTAKAAKELLEFFNGDPEICLNCIEDIVKKLNDKKLSWTPQTICKWKVDWKRQIDKMGKYYDIGKSNLLEEGQNDER